MRHLEAVVDDQPDEARNERRGGRARQPLEEPLVDHLNIGVEARQTQRRAANVHKGRQPAPASDVMQDPFVHHQRRGDTKRSHVRQRVILLAEGRGGVGQPGYPTVHAVKHHGHEDRDGRDLEAGVHCLDNRKEPCKECSRGERVRQQVNATVTVLRIAGRKSHHNQEIASGKSASTVLVALTLSPMATRGREPGGR